MEFLQDIQNIMLPETVIAVFIFIQIMLAMFMDTKFYKLSKWISVFGIFLATSMCLKVQIEPIYYAFKLSVVSDTYTLFFKCLILIASFLLTFLTKRALETNRNSAFKYNALYLSAILGALLIVSANDFLILYIAMELLSISVCFMIAFDKGYPSKEAAFKYIITSVVATAVFLFGLSYLYGLTHSFNFSVIYEYFTKEDPILLYTMGAIFICSGLCFKLGVTPFANWIVDVYEGAGTPTIAFISIVPKVAMLATLARLLVFPLSYSFELTFVLVILSVVTAIWANTIALKQRNIKKILASSSSANAAYVLFAASLVSVYNLSTVIFYLFAYIFMNIGVFAAIVILENSSFSNKLYEFKNFAYTNPIFTLCFAICILSLAGFPVTSGFISKIYLFSAIARSGLVFLPFLAVILITVLTGAFYYLNIVKFMFEKSDKVESEVIQHRVSSAIIILYFCAIATVLIGFFPEKIIEMCQLIAFNA